MTQPVRIANCSGFYGDRLTRGPRDGRGRAHRRAHRRLPRRADDAHPLEEPRQAPRRRLRHDVPAPGRGRARHLPRQGHPHRRQRGRPQPGRLRRRRPRHRRSARPDVRRRPHRGRRPAPPARRSAGRRARPGPPRDRSSRSPTAGIEPVTANAYLGGWGIAAALDAGADVVVCPRVTDASLVVGPAAWWHGWAGDDWDQLAGAVVAGHVLECGAQATGGNYAFFTRGARPRLVRASRSPRSAPTAHRSSPSTRGRAASSRSAP